VNASVKESSDMDLIYKLLTIHGGLAQSATD